MNRLCYHFWDFWVSTTSKEAQSKFEYNLFFPHQNAVIAKLSLSSVPVQSNLNWDLALNLVITTPTPTHPGK